MGSFVWQPRPGVFSQTVVCKITFELAPGVSRVAPSAVGVVAFDESDERRGLVQATDFVPFKARPEVIVLGSAHAVGARPVPFLRARVKVGEVDKSIAVYGDRTLWTDGASPEPALFVTMPLTWDRAAGGPDTANPVGIPTGPTAPQDTWGRVRLPNLQPVSGLPPSRTEIIPPIGFGPISPAWPGRRSRLHHHAPTWDALRWAERPLPQDFDGAYFQAVTPDQWLVEIRPEEPIVLENLHPHIPELATRLPRAVPAAIAETASGTAPLRLRCDTLIIDADRGVASLVYRGQVPLEHPQQAGRVVVSLEAASPGPSVGVPSAAPPFSPRTPLMPGAVPAPSSRGRTLVTEVAPASQTRPVFVPPAGSETLVVSSTGEDAELEPSPADIESFIAKNPELVSLPREEAHVVAVRLLRLAGRVKLDRKKTIAAASPPSKPALPFAEREAVIPPASSSFAQDEQDAMGKAVLPFAGTEASPSEPPVEPTNDTTALPFRPQVVAQVGASSLGRSMRLQPLSTPQPAPPPPPPPAPAPAPRADEGFTGTADTDLPPPGDDIPAPPPMIWAPPPVIPGVAPAFVPPPSVVAPFSVGGDIESPQPSPAREPPLQIPLSTGDTLAPPGMLDAVSPLQIPLSAAGETPPPPGMLGGPQGASLPVASPPDPAANPGPAAEPEPAAEPPLPLDEYPLERCARIAAGIALRPSEQGARLEKEALTPAVWERLHAHFAEVLGEESRRGKNDKGRAYDEAYVGALEAIRGALTPSEYAQITVAVERSETASALEALDLVEAALPHVRRVWLQRIVSDPALAKQARSAVRAARSAG